MDPREWLFDVRILNRNLDKGAINKKSLNDHVRALPDLDGEFDEIDIMSGKEEAAAEEAGEPVEETPTIGE